jgi:D-glycero-D-manno-heptose 1,7-bisphosphate phosphatase
VKPAPTGRGLRVAAFLDRDGTIIREYGHFWEPQMIQLAPGAVEGIRVLKGAGFLCIVATNQSGIARGIFDEHQFWIGHKRVEELLNEHGIKLDGVYFCPHHPTEGDTPYRMECDCRKPKPGMLLHAARDFGIDLPHSFMVGDSPVDVGAAKAAGASAVKVETAYGKGVSNLVTQGPAQLPDGRVVQPDFRASDLAAAARWILSGRR